MAKFHLIHTAHVTPASRALLLAGLPRPERMVKQAPSGSGVGRVVFGPPASEHLQSAITSSAPAVPTLDVERGALGLASLRLDTGDWGQTSHVQHARMTGAAGTLREGKVPQSRRRCISRTG